MNAPSVRAPRAGTVAAGALGRLSVGQTRIAAILAGGAVGALARAILAEEVPHRPGTWPWATFVVNLLGALTTFSTFQIETFELARGGHALLALGYPLVSIVAGMALATTGVLLARWGRHW